MIAELLAQPVLPGVPELPPNFAQWARAWYQRRYPDLTAQPEWPAVLTAAQAEVPYRFIPQSELADQWVSRNLWTMLRRDGKVMKQTVEQEGTAPRRYVAVQMALPWRDFRAEALNRLRLAENGISRVEADVAEYIAQHAEMGLDVITELSALRLESTAA